MMLLTKHDIARLPKLYSREHVTDPECLIKFFDPTGSWTWYVIEGEKQENGDYLFFGYVQGFESELGYFTLSELQNAKNGLTGLRSLPIERDRYYKPVKLSDIKTRERGAYL